MKIRHRQATPVSLQRPSPVADVVDTVGPKGDTVHLAGKEMPVAPASLGTKLSLGVCAVGGAWALSNVVAQVASQPTLGGVLVSSGLALGAAVAAYQGADLFSGFFHHGMDNYAKSTTPVVGETAAIARSHHYFANSSEQTSVAGEMDPIAKVVAPALAALAVLDPHYAIAAGSLGALGAVLLCQVSHRWTHLAKPPAIVEGMTKLGLVQKREDHHAHHRAPWISNYCFVNGSFNPILDKTNFWRHYERTVFNVTGVEPKSWNHPAVKDLALGKIDQAEFDGRFKAEIPLFKAAIGFEAEREESRQFLHGRFV